MPIEKSDFVRHLATQVLDDRVSLFMGAGASTDAGYPSWAKLFRPLAQDLDIPIGDSTDYYRLAQYYANRYGLAELRMKINESINILHSGSPLLDQLAKVGFADIWTTNFDNALEHCFDKQGITVNKFFRDGDMANVDTRRGVNIFKLNGDISNLDGIVATQGDYERYAETHRVFLMFLKRALISHTFLFIGYSFTDHLVLDCISEISRILGQSMKTHYTVLKDKPGDQYFQYLVHDLEERYNVKALIVAEYDEIPAMLAELNERIRSRRVFVSGAHGAADDELQRYSNLFARHAAEALLISGYRITNGIGAHFGTQLIGYAHEYLARRAERNIDRYVTVRPFVGDDEDSAQRKEALRRRVIDTCGAAIFVFGEHDRNGVGNISGVMEEFRIADELGRVVIPIGYPGTVSGEIHSMVQRNLTRYAYLERVLNSLISTEPIEALMRKIIYVLDSSRPSW